jgi:hypothetical protein
MLGDDPRIHSDSAKGIKQPRTQMGFMGGKPPKAMNTSDRKDAENEALNMIYNGDSMEKIVEEIMEKFGVTEEEAQDIVSKAETTRNRMEGPEDEMMDDELDTDGDGVPDADDCDPYDPDKQDDDVEMTEIGDFLARQQRMAPSDADDTVTEVEEITKDVKEGPTAFTKIRRAGKVAFGKVSQLVTDYREDRENFKQQLHDLSDSQLKEAAVRFQGSGGGFFGGGENPFTKEAVRRIKEGKKFDEQVKTAQISEKDGQSDGFSIKDLL